MEKVLWHIEHVKSGANFHASWCSMARETSWSWEWSNQDINWEHSIYTMQETADILKISKWSAENHLYQLGYVNHFDVWVPHKLSKKKKTFLTIFLHVILYLNVTKMFHF